MAGLEIDKLTPRQLALWGFLIKERLTPSDARRWEEDTTSFTPVAKFWRSKTGRDDTDDEISTLSVDILRVSVYHGLLCQYPDGGQAWNDSVSNCKTAQQLEMALDSGIIKNIKDKKHASAAMSPDTPAPAKGDQEGPATAGTWTSSSNKTTAPPSSINRSGAGTLQTNKSVLRPVAGDCLKNSMGTSGTSRVMKQAFVQWSSAAAGKKNSSALSKTTAPKASVDSAPILQKPSTTIKSHMSNSPAPQGLKDTTTKDHKGSVAAAGGMSMTASDSKMCCNLEEQA